MSEKIINNGSSRRNNKEQPLPAKSVIPRNQRCRHFLFSLFHNVSSHLLSRAHRLFSSRGDLALELGKVVLVAQFCCENNLGVSSSHLLRLINTHTLTHRLPRISALSSNPIMFNCSTHPSKNVRHPERKTSQLLVCQVKSSQCTVRTRSRLMRL